MKAITLKAPAMPKIAETGKKVMNYYCAHRLRICVVSGIISYAGLLLEMQSALFCGAFAAILSTLPVDKGEEVKK